MAAETTTTSTLQADLSVLPLAASIDPTKPAAQVRDSWSQTITYLDTIRNAQRAYSVNLGLKLDSARYWAAAALDVIKKWEAGGGTGAEAATTISGLSAPSAEYQKELSAAKALWAQEINGVVSKPTLLQSMTAPRTDTDYLLWGAAGLALFLLWATRGGK